VNPLKHCGAFYANGHCKIRKNHEDNTIEGICSKCEKAAKAKEKDPQSHKSEKKRPSQAQKAPKANGKDPQSHKSENDQPPKVQKAPKADQKDLHSHKHEKEQPQAQQAPKANEKHPHSHKHEKKQPSHAHEVSEEAQRALVRRIESRIEAEREESEQMEQVRAAKDQWFAVEREENVEYIAEAADIEAAEYEAREARRRERARASNPPPQRSALKSTSRTVRKPQNVEFVEPAPTKHSRGYSTPKVPKTAHGYTYPYPAPPTAYAYQQMPPYPTTNTTSAPQGYGYPPPQQIPYPQQRHKNPSKGARKAEPDSWSELLPD